MKMKTLLEKYQECLMNIEEFKKLSEAEQKIIIEYEIYEHKCTKTWNIAPVLEIFKDIFDEKLILSVWQKVKNRYMEDSSNRINKLFDDFERW